MNAEGYVTPVIASYSCGTPYHSIPLPPNNAPSLFFKKTSDA
jgi:hypothetical protein